MGDITKNLNKAEVSCKCGCGYATISDELASKFQLARDLFGEAIRVNSGCRCEKHNVKVGGDKNSSHVKGLAMDLTCKDPTPSRLVRLGIVLGMAGFQRFEIHKTFIHVDVDKDKTSPRIVIKS